MLILSRGPRVCLGLAFTLGTLLLITAQSMPDALGDYLQRLPLNIDFIQVQHVYLWERHVTLKALFRLLFQGRGPGETSLLVQILTVASSRRRRRRPAFALLRSRRDDTAECWTGDTVPPPRPAYRLDDPRHAAGHALLFRLRPDAAVGAGRVAGGRIAFGPLGASLSSSDRKLVGGWVALYLCVMINPILAGRCA